MYRFFSYRTTTIVLVALILTAVIYGFAAANTVPESGAGDGSGTISGYTISNISYTLLSTDPGKISAVSFTVTPTAGAGAANTVMAAIDTTWATCSNTGGSNWTCSFSAGSEPSVSAASTLRVVATE
ncbi:MAG: hypothetical protein D6770_07390 [Anaerolineae bacterium]|nr:MAG: hypothetical protein D6770_07390 [Anaerolineae bacterium]